MTPAPAMPTSRRGVLVGVAGAVAIGTAGAPSFAVRQIAATSSSRSRGDGFVRTEDGALIHYRDWGDGPAVVLSHGWPLNADAWEDQALFLASKGFRVVAHDRRGHGRSSQAWAGNDIDHYADDLAAVINQLDLHDIALVGHSTGAGEVSRYIGRHGNARVRKAMLVSGIPPIRLRTAANPDGAPMKNFDELRIKVGSDRAQFYRELSVPFFGADRPGARVSVGTRDSFWLQCMAAGLKAVHDGIKAQTETDFTPDLLRFEIPTIIIHGSEDQLVPIGNSAVLMQRLIRSARLEIYPGAPHGLTTTHRDRFNADLLAFVQA